ncbi:MAG: PQQ-binding-like beta-propeller repeat protein [Halobacteriaceae archaeon]
MDFDGRLTRRRWLSSLAAATGSIAGCAAPLGDGTSADSDAPSSDSDPTTRAGGAGDDSAWPTFRGDDRNTGCALNDHAPADYPERKWTVSIGDGVWSSPVVADGRLYIGSMDYKVYAIDAATGEIDWTYETDGPVQSTPTVADGRVYVGSFDKHVYCLDAETGTKQWSHETAGLVNSSPTVDDSRVYIGSGVIGVGEVHSYLESSGVEPEGGGLYALNRETGALEWRRYPTYRISSTPAVVDSTVYIGLTDGEPNRPLIAALDASSGDAEWEFETNNAAITSPSVQSGRVYCATFFGTVHALSTETGEEAWGFNIGDGDIRGSTAVCDGSVYVPASGNKLGERSDNPVLYSLSVDGDVQWEHEIPGARQMGSSPAVTSDAIYVGTHFRNGGGGMYAVSHAGERLWGREVEDGEGVGSSPAVDDGTLYYGADNGIVYALE